MDYTLTPYYLLAPSRQGVLRAVQLCGSRSQAVIALLRDHREKAFISTDPEGNGRKVGWKERASDGTLKTRFSCSPEDEVEVLKEVKIVGQFAEETGFDPTNSEAGFPGQEFKAWLNAKQGQALHQLQSI